MPKYTGFKYDTGVYGQVARLADSVAPLTSTTLSYNTVQVQWAAPAGNYIAIRLLRNQDGFGENEEDGVLLWEEFAVGGSFTRTSYLDGVDNLLDARVDNNLAFVPGKYNYYSVWLKTLENIWAFAGGTYSLIPKEHGTYSASNKFLTTHDKVMDLLPRVYTSPSGSPIDEVDLESDLSNFLSAFSFTLDELYTFADLVVTDNSGEHTNPPFVQLQSQQLGVPLEPNLPLKNQKRLVRDSLYTYGVKGTKTGLRNVIEDLSSWSPDITVSNNLMLSVQDSSFYNGLGFWTADNGAGLTVEAGIPVPSSDINAVDATYCAKIVNSVPGQTITNGISSPLTKGVPVAAGQDYTFSFYQKSLSGANATDASISWFTSNEALISTSSTSSPVAAGTSWGRTSLTATAPESAAYAAFTITFQGTIETYWIDRVQFEAGTMSEYTEARAVNVFINAKKTNYIMNPSFEGDAESWSISATGSPSFPTTTLPHVQSGSQMLQITSKTNNTTYLSTETTTGAVPVGSIYCYSIYAKTVSGTETLTIELVSTDGVSTVGKTDTITVTEDWQRFYVRVYIPSSFEVTTTYLNALITGTTTGNVLQFDAAQIEASYYPTDYFDGSLPGYYGTYWGGTVNNSISYAYPNRANKMGRLISTIAEYVPTNTPVIVSSHAGVESKFVSY